MIVVNKINQKISDMCFSRGWSFYDLALEAGLTQSTISSSINRDNPPKIETLQCICDAFGITLSQFFLDDEQIEVLSPSEKELISLFRKLSEEKKQALLKLINR